MSKQPTAHSSDVTRAASLYASLTPQAAPAPAPVVEGAGYIRFSWTAAPASAPAPASLVPLPSVPPARTVTASRAATASLPAVARPSSVTLAPVVPVAASQLPAPVPDAIFGADRWNAALDWCLPVTHAQSAFVMDTQGLVVAARGALAAEDAEIMGSRVLVALDQVDRIQVEEERVTCMALHFETRVLSILRVGRGEQGVVLAVLGKEPLGATTREAVVDMLDVQMGG